MWFITAEPQANNNNPKQTSKKTEVSLPAAAINPTAVVIVTNTVIFIFVSSANILSLSFNRNQVISFFV